MDHCSAHSLDSGKKSPKVPIKTYKWEDVRRSRRKGGYPWTYLTKDQFNEENDYDLIMNGLRKNKTNSSLSGTESVDIKEITEDDIKELENIDSSYVVIESPILFSAAENRLKDHDQTAIESAESSDNISQYLDKEETTDTSRQLESTETLTIPSTLTPDVLDANKKERAKSEEPRKKRKHSLESNHSNISLPKLSLKKRFEEAKNKFKINLPKKISKTEKNNVVDKKPPLPKGKVEKPKIKIDDKPVYIHIPLKPPEGESDAFSYLEFEEKSPIQPEIKVEEPEEKKDDQTKPDEVEIENNTNTLSLNIDNNEDDVSAIIFLESDDVGDKNDFDIMVIDMNENGDTTEMTIEEVVNEDLRNQVLDSLKKVESFGELTQKGSSSLSRSSSEKKLSKKIGSVGELQMANKNGEKVNRSSSRASDSKRNKRAKSEEPAKKRRNSIESATSRKSLSKLALLKKIKSFNFPFSSLKRAHSSKSVKSSKEDKNVKLEEKESRPVTKTNIKPPTDAKPVYIHIPLKPPLGETDEFSHLEFEKPSSNKELVEPDQNLLAKEETNTEPLSPIDDPHPQFIFLTPPSDDEILDKPDVPETPSSECESLFSSRIGELKELAKSAVDQFEDNRLSTVEEENSATSEITTVLEDMNKEELIIDEEDGLQSSSRASAEEQKVLKSSLKGEASPVLKKKVSFKRRNTKDSTISDDYEYVATPLDEKIRKEISDEEKIFSEDKECTPSMSVTEEKAYLDEKITNTTSLEEDYKHWSKISDHEYEPVNPPPEVPATRDESPKLKILEPQIDRFTRPQYSDEDTQNDISIQEMQLDIESKFFNRPTIQQNIEKSRDSPKPSSEKKSPSPKRGNEETKAQAIQSSIKEGANKIKNKFQSIKKPNISLPTRPKFTKAKFNFPKMPNAKDLHLPNFRLTRNQPTNTNKSKSSIKQRQYSTESNAGDSNKPRIFDFRTYPRFLRKNTKPSSDTTSLENYEIKKEPKKKPAKAYTVENDRWGDQTSIRIPLHSEDSIEKDNTIEVSNESTELEESPYNYNENIDVEDKYEEENKTINRIANEKELYKREDFQKHGLFIRQNTASFDEDSNKMVTDLDEPYLAQHTSFDTNQSKDGNSSVSSLGQHRRGVIEEIDSDQFFLREKGISQDNIDMGMYLTSEIREAFRSPQSQNNDQIFMSYQPDMRGSNTSLPEPKRKQVKKPKRKKTPHASNERISQSSREQMESEEDTMIYNYMPPSRPKRKSKKQKKRLIVPYQETISYLVSDEKLGPSQEEFGKEKYPNDSIFMPSNEEYNDQSEENNEHMDFIDDEVIIQNVNPEVPPRKNKSLRSLNSDRGSSILGQFDLGDDYHRYNNNILGYQLDQRDRSASPSIINDTIDISISKTNEASFPKRPERKRSRTRSQSRVKSQPEISEEFEVSILTHHDEGNHHPVVEEPCIKDLRDSMGYAIVDKNGQQRSWEHKFCSVPRKLKNKPTKSTRNYHTIGPTRPPRKKNLTDEEKENIDIIQYIEIDEDRNIKSGDEDRKLKSGEVIQKIQNRPLPAPPRPPRKTRTLDDEEHEDINPINENEDINLINRQEGTHLINEQETINIINEKEDIHLINEKEDINPINEHEDITKILEHIEETEVSTQTDPLPDDFICEEVVQEETDKIITPSVARKNEINKKLEEINTKLITPTRYSYDEETITHGQLVVEPLNGAKILPDLEHSPKERIVPIDKDLEESDIPESFHQLADPIDNKETRVEDNKQNKENNQKNITIEPIIPNLELIKTQKLQISDLDIDRLTVNELVANKIIVSEIESGNIVTNSISSQSGSLQVGEIGLDSAVIQKIIEKLQTSIDNSQTHQSEDKENEKSEQKKTPIELDSKLVEKNKENTCEAINEDFSVPLEVITNEHISNLSEKSESEEKGSIEYNLDTNLDLIANTIPIVDNNNIDNQILETEQIQPPVAPKRKSKGNIEIKNIPEEKNEEEVHLVHKEAAVSSTQNNERQLSTPTKSEDVPSFVEDDIDNEPPPRPPALPIGYVPSQPPAHFYALKAQQYVEDNSNIPIASRRKRHHRPTISRSTSSESIEVPIPRRRYRSPEPSIPQLTGQLVRACSTVTKNAIKRLIDQINATISKNSNNNDGAKQDIQVIMVILLVLIAGLLLLGYGDGKTVHLHHWEYFNPPGKL